MQESEQDATAIAIGEKLFQWRDFTPIPLVVILLFTAEPTAVSATLGLLMVLAGELLRLYGVSFIGSVSRTRSLSVGAQLITHGPFAYVRNPLYVGNFILATGIATYGGSVWFVLLSVVAISFQYYCIVQFEEKLLSDIFGEEFDRYCESVPAWFPKKLPTLQEIEFPTDLREAFQSEKKTFLAILLMIFALMVLSRS